MDRNKKIALTLIFALLAPAMALAQESDFGLWLSAGAQKKINKKWSVSIDGDFRTRNDAQTIDRWDIGLSADYKITKWLKASAGYQLRVDNNREKLTYNPNGSYNNWRPSYWSERHSLFASLTGSLDFGRFSLSLRERWQYVYRPEATTDRYDFDNEWWEETTVSGKARNVLRSRLRVSYDIPKCKVDPYADVELFNYWSLQKVRYTIGADWKVSKQHSIGLFYRFQDNNSDSSEVDQLHVIGVGYSFKF